MERSGSFAGGVRSGYSVRSVSSRALLPGVSGSSSRSRRRWPCCGGRGRCVNLLLFVSLLLSASSLVISSISLASMFPVVEQKPFPDSSVYIPCRLFLVGMRSRALSDRCADFFLGLSSRDVEVGDGRFDVEAPPVAHRDGLSKAYLTSVSTVISHEVETRSQDAKLAVPNVVLQMEQTDAEVSEEIEDEADIGNVVEMEDVSDARLESRIGAGSGGVTRTVGSSEWTRNGGGLDVVNGRIRSDHTVTSLYSLRNDFGSRVTYYEFRSLCFNSTHLLIVGAETCMEGQDAATGSGFEPVACDDGLYDVRRRMFEETRLEEAKTTYDWLQERNVTWWNGTSAILHLDKSSLNVAHFIGKVNGLLVFNNLSFPMYTDFVDRVLVLKHDNVWKQFRLRVENLQSFSVMYVAHTLSRLLRNVVKEGLTANSLLGSMFAGEGRVKIGMIWDELIASDHEPMCFEKVVIPGLFKATQYPGGMITADHVRKSLQDLYLNVNQSGALGETEIPNAPVLLYLVRNGKRRTFFPDSEQAFRDVLQETRFGTSILDFNQLTFQEQFWAIQKADLFIGLHGTSLMNPTMFARKRSVLVEVIPYNVALRIYETQSIDTGLVYLGHQCLQGTIQKKDQRFARYKYMNCMKHAECKDRFLQQRSVELTAQDLTELRQLISIGMELVLQIERKGLKDKVSSELFDEVERLVGKGRCQPWISGVKDMCRGNWVSFGDERGYHICYLNYACDQGNSNRM